MADIIISPVAGVETGSIAGMGADGVIPVLAETLEAAKKLAASF